MLSSLRHPTLDRLSDFLAGEAAASRPRIATHLERCSSCRKSLRFLRDASGAAKEVPLAEPSAGLRDRVISSRAAGARTILPLHDARQQGRRWMSPAVAAALLAALAGTMLVRRPNAMEAGTTRGTLIFSPAAPQPGQRVTVSYRPSALLATQPWLALRARLRSRTGESYNGGIPVTTVAQLRAGSGDVFTASFVLPDTVVYGAFVVEDSSAGVIDDDGSRSWEILVSEAYGRPLFDALEQRANDMMGRNWEEGLATAQRMVALYPESLVGWNWLHSFHSWSGRAEDDSIRSLHRRRLVAFDSEFTPQQAIAPDQEGWLAWYASSIDSTVAARWRTRLLREAPTNSFAIQWRLMAALDSLRTTRDTAQALHRLDSLWSEAPRDRLSQVATYGTSLAFESGDSTLIERWTSRLTQSARDPRATARWVATRFATVPALRGEAIRRLRAELDGNARLPSAERALDETAAEQRARHAGTRRQMMAALGQALVEDGQTAEGRRALADAAASGWDPDVFRAVRKASLVAGDSGRALEMAAWLAADPRTAPAFADSVRASAQRRLGDAGWHRELDSARALFVERMLAGASARSLSGDGRVRDLNGRAHSVRDLTKGHVTVVAFWSRFCGPAVEAIPRMNEVASRLARVGVPVVSILDERRSSPALRAFLREKHVTTPVYLDSRHEASLAFNQWGTPYFYVVDGEGRIRFDVTNSPDEALARAEVLRLSASTAGAVSVGSL